MHRRNEILEGLIVSGIAGLISGFLGGGQSPQEEEVRKILDQLYEQVDWIKQLPFSKEELMNGVLPQVQKTFRGGANVAAGQIGSTIPEVSGAPAGQSFMEYYTQALAPTIAQGENLAGKAQMDITQMYINEKQTAGNQISDIYRIMLGAASGLPAQSGAQRFFTNFAQGMNLGAAAYGNINMADALGRQADSASEIAKLFMSGNEGLMKLYQQIFGGRKLGSSNPFEKGGG